MTGQSICYWRYYPDYQPAERWEDTQYNTNGPCPIKTGMTIERDDNNVPSFGDDWFTFPLIIKDTTAGTQTAFEDAV